MNSNSSISYSKNFKSNKREIKLTGEAFFEVAKDSLRPFVVISEDLLITALGTSFNVKAHADEQNISISLLTGKVAVQKKNTIESALLLNPNEAALLNREDGALQRKEFNYEEDILWTKGILYLKQIPITEAFLKLELWYGVTFEIENLPKKTLLVTGTFDNEYLENVLQSLSHTASFKYNIKNGKIMVSFKK
jgi:ferric-dicitrate binding protein FerR (iron transport regulator)